MAKLLIVIVILLVIFLLALPFERKRKRLLNAYWIRSCTGKEWINKFPHCSKESIREFLTIFVDAFLFDAKKRLKFKPDDRIMDVYYASYPEKGWADALELEYFAKSMKTRYGVDLYTVKNNDVTLGEIFEMTRMTCRDTNNRVHSP